LFAIWETTPYNGHWPQVTIIWEIDGFADYARLGAARARGGSHEAAAGKWSAFLADIGASGEGRIIYPGHSNKTLAQQRETNFAAPLVIQEIMQTKPGRQDDYIRELERLYVPWSERTGKRWLGSFTATFRYNEVIHYWALDGDWECFANHYPSWKDSPPPEIVTAMSGQPEPVDFAYDPFDARVMANPLPYYRILECACFVSQYPRLPIVLDGLRRTRYCPSIPWNLASLRGVEGSSPSRPVAFPRTRRPHGCLDQQTQDVCAVSGRRPCTRVAVLFEGQNQGRA
jgi:hypothetical protein